MGTMNTHRCLGALASLTVVIPLAACGGKVLVASGGASGSGAQTSTAAGASAATGGACLTSATGGGATGPATPHGTQCAMVGRKNRPPASGAASFLTADFCYQVTSGND